MESLGAILIVLIILLLLVGVISLIALIIMAIAKKKIKVPSIITGVSFGSAIFLFIVMLIVGIIATSGENETNTVATKDAPSSSTNASSEDEGDISEISTANDDAKTDGIDLSEYNEADFNKLHNNEYEKQTKLKVTDAEVISITPSEESFGDGVGNMVVAHVDNVPVIIHDMIGYDFELNNYYTFYGSPNMEDGLILIEYEESDVETVEEIEETPEVEEETGFTFGDTADIAGIAFTVDSSYYTDERNSLTDVVADQVLMIDMSFTNNTGQEYSPTFGIDVYADGVKVDKYPVGDISLDMVSDGRSATASIAYAIIGNPSEIELEFAPRISRSGEKAVFTVTPE